MKMGNDRSRYLHRWVKRSLRLGAVAGVQNRATYRNAQNQICHTINRRLGCLSGRAYQKEQENRERRATSNREYLHDRID